MEFDAVLLPPRRAESVVRGYWHDRTINDDLDACLVACPDKLALTAVRQDTSEVRRFTYRQLATLSNRLRSDCPALAWGATMLSPCNCRTGGSSACCTSPARG